MSFEITAAFVQQYKDNVVHLAQQKGSRLRNTVRIQPDIVGVNYYFERIGATGMQVKGSRHSDTPIISTPHSRRRVSMVTYNWGDLIDNDDKLKLLINPESQYVIAATNAAGRNIDDIVIAGALGTAYAGTDGQTAVTFPTAQIVSDAALNNLTALDAGTNDGGHMSPQRLLAVKQLFDAADVDPDEDRFIVVSPFQLKSMLQFVSVTSADYNTVKALAEGAVDTYMGFKFIMSNRLPTSGGTDGLGNSYPTLTGEAAGDTLCMAYSRNGIGLAVQEDIKVEIARRPDKNFATQVYLEMVMGATRIEEARVARVPCKSS